MKPDERDYQLVRKAFQLWQESGKSFIVAFRCFNKEEADMLKSLANSLFPEMPVTTSYLVFGN